ncbi:MAG TPA: 5'/3'-nucleotidase SurE [Clostridiales bacterium]|nr:5'/3'-nucleotidase SurE [Clostridiales bacterium]
MRFLVSNDDGIYADGLIQLAVSLSSLGEVTVVAPDTERSATGHAITMHHPLRVRKVNLPGLKIKAFAVDGTPADCVKLGIDELLDYRPDFVLTGINRGANLGTDVLYSGTVSAAIEGCIMGVPSLAFSLLSAEVMDYSTAGRIAAEVVGMISDKNLTPSTLVNVNIPNVPLEQIKGMKVTRLGHRRYSKNYEKRLDPRGRTYYWLAGELIEEAMASDTDIEAVKNLYVSITPLHFDLTSYKMLDSLKRWGFDHDIRSK